MPILCCTHSLVIQKCQWYPPPVPILQRRVRPKGGVQPIVLSTTCIHTFLHTIKFHDHFGTTYPPLCIPVLLCYHLSVTYLPISCLAFSFTIVPLHKIMQNYYRKKEPPMSRLTEA